MSRSRLNDTMGYLKQARLFSAGDRNQSLGGHVNWASKQSRSRVESSVMLQIRTLRDVWHL
ncbi:MAG: hypothetical protein R3C59_28365 [Planctomycetaceae bacterium]